MCRVAVGKKGLGHPKKRVEQKLLRRVENKHERDVWDVALSDVSGGNYLGPFSEFVGTEDWLPMPRFAVDQGKSKMSAIDEASISDFMAIWVR